VVGRAHTGPRTQPLRGLVKADLVVVGGGYTGLWAAIEALTADPGRRVVGAAGRRAVRRRSHGSPMVGITKMDRAAQVLPYPTREL